MDAKVCTSGFADWECAKNRMIAKDRMGLSKLYFPVLCRERYMKSSIPIPTNALYTEVNAFRAGIDPTIGECLRRKVDDLVQFIIMYCIDLTAELPAVGAMPSLGIVREAQGKLEHLETSLRECDVIIDGLENLTHPSPDQMRLLTELQRVRDLIGETIHTARERVEFAI
jgi:hypothetical protein